MSWTQTTIDLAGAVRANAYVARPAGSAKAIVHINHGMAEHAARYERFATALAAAGYAVIAHDHRGHGHTVAPGTAQGWFGPGGWDALIDESVQVSRHAKIEFGDAPIVVFGHSMGAIAALNIAMREPALPAALAVWNSGVENGALISVLRSILKVQRAFKGSDVPSGFARKASFDAWNKQFAPNRTDFDWLSRDEAEVDKYVADPLCGFPVTIGMWLDVLSGVAFGSDDANLNKLPKALPVHLLAGAEDPCSEKGGAVRHIEQRMRTAGMSDVTFDLLPDTRHESLNELNRDETTARFVAWLEERLS
ncbi:MAG: alpha/beta hydrolase [Pseudomonadota bacterium]